MPTQGPFQWFDTALDKITANGPVDLDSDTFHAVLCDTADALSATFTGTSGNGRYADLLHELATGSGYTSGGLALVSPTLSRSTNVVKWTVNSFSWTLTATIAFQYLVIVDWTTANKDLLAFADCTSGTGNMNVAAGALQFTPNANGVLGWSQ